MYSFLCDCITIISNHSSIMSGSDEENGPWGSNYVTNLGVKQKKHRPSEFNWNVKRLTASGPYYDCKGVKVRSLMPALVWGWNDYHIYWITWTEYNEKQLSTMKSKGKKHWRKGEEDDDVFLSKIKEKLNDHVTKRILSYCTLIHVENL